MKENLRKGLVILLVLIFAAGGTLVLWQLYNYRASDQACDAAQELAVPAIPDSIPTPTPAVQPNLPERLESGVTESPEEPVQEQLEENVRFLLDLDLEALRQTNDRVLGWIHIPDNPIDYPLLQVKDNKEYLRRAWDGTENQAGCIFLECKNSRDFDDFNTLIYGHFMRNGKMFGSLHSYREQEYRDAHPCIYVVTDAWVYRYEVFAAYEADVVSDTYRLYFEDEEVKLRALAYYQNSSVVKSDIRPTVDDRILTLSTCMGTGTYDTRWVVQAVRTGQFPLILVRE